MFVVAEKNKGGRPYIGPEIKTRVPEDTEQLIKHEAEERGISISAVTSELIHLGLKARKEGRK